MVQVPLPLGHQTLLLLVGHARGTFSSQIQMCCFTVGGLQEHLPTTRWRQHDTRVWILNVRLCCCVNIYRAKVGSLSAKYKIVCTDARMFPDAKLVLFALSLLNWCVSEVINWTVRMLNWFVWSAVNTLDSQVNTDASQMVA